MHVSVCLCSFGPPTLPVICFQFRQITDLQHMRSKMNSQQISKCMLLTACDFDVRGGSQTHDNMTFAVLPSLYGM